MNRSASTLIMATIFTIAGIIFATQHEWLTAIVFIIISVIYVIKGMNRGQSKKVIWISITEIVNLCFKWHKVIFKIASQCSYKYIDWLFLNFVINER